MQLSEQCTSILVNLTRISNQVRRWMEGVFSSSMYASSNQMCKSKPPKAGHLLFISPSTKEPLATFTRPPTSGALWLATCPPLNLARQSLTVTCRPLDATKWAPNASGTHRTHAQTGLQTLDLTRLGAPDASVLTGLVCREGCKTPSNRTHSEHPVLSVRYPRLKSGHTRHMNREHLVFGAQHK